VQGEDHLRITTELGKRKCASYISCYNIDFGHKVD